MSKKSKSTKTDAAAANDEALSSTQPSGHQEQEQEQESVQKGHGAQASKDMGAMINLLTDMQSGDLELSNTEKVLKSISATVQERKLQRQSEKQKEHSKQPMDEDAVQLIMTEFELARPAAEHQLREHGGDVGKALRALVA